MNKAEKLATQLEDGDGLTSHIEAAAFLRLLAERVETLRLAFSAQEKWIELWDVRQLQADNEALLKVYEACESVIENNGKLNCPPVIRIAVADYKKGREGCHRRKVTR